MLLDLYEVLIYFTIWTSIGYLIVRWLVLKMEEAEEMHIGKPLSEATGHLAAAALWPIPLCFVFYILNEKKVDKFIRALNPLNIFVAWGAYIQHSNSRKLLKKQYDAALAAENRAAGDPV